MLSSASCRRSSRCRPASKSSTGCSRCSAAGSCLRTPMLFAVGFIVTFVIGGLTGVLLAVPPVDFVLHNSAFLVAHFHNVIIGGVVFGALAGYQLLVPEGVRVHARRTLGPGQLLVLAHRLLSRLHAALCAGPDGHDPAPRAHSRTRAGSRCCWSRRSGPSSFSAESSARSRSSMSASARASSAAT